MEQLHGHRVRDAHPTYTLQSGAWSTLPFTMEQLLFQLPCGHHESELRVPSLLQRCLTAEIHWRRSSVCVLVTGGTYRHFLTLSPCSVLFRRITRRNDLDMRISEYGKIA